MSKHTLDGQCVGQQSCEKERSAQEKNNIMNFFLLAFAKK